MKEPDVIKACGNCHFHEECNDVRYCFHPAGIVQRQQTVDGKVMCAEQQHCRGMERFVPAERFYLMLAEVPKVEAIEMVDGKAEVVAMVDDEGKVVEPPEPPIDTTNRFAVGVRGDFIVIQALPLHRPLSHDEAINLAAWLLAMAHDTKHSFVDVYDAICNA